MASQTTILFSLVATILLFLLSISVEGRECSDGKVYSSCGTACPPTCKDPNPLICDAECVEGCFCPPENPILQADGLSCGELEDCGETCPGDMIWSNCGASCVASCENPNPNCATICEPGCVCPPSKPFHLGNGKCGVLRDCNIYRPCPGKMIWSDCATDCPKQCTQPKGEICSAECFVGCACPSDAPVLLKDGVCGRPKDCKARNRRSCISIQSARRCLAAGCFWHRRQHLCRFDG